MDEIAPNPAVNRTPLNEKGRVENSFNPDRPENLFASPSTAFYRKVDNCATRFVAACFV
jgi:hypothetical protein